MFVLKNRAGAEIEMQTYDRTKMNKFYKEGLQEAS